MAKTQNIMLATCFALIAAVAYALTAVFVKLIGNSTTTTVVVFFRFSLSLIILLPWFLKDPALFKITQPKNFILRSISGLLALSCMFYAFKYISLADGLLLNNTNALFVPVLAWIMLRTITPIKVWIATLIGFIGVICILHPDKGIFNYAALIGLASGFFGGISLVQIRQLTKINSTQQILFYYFLTGTIVAGLILPFLWVTPNLHVWLLLIAIGVFSAIYQVLMVLSFTYAPVRLMSTVMFSCVAFGAFFDWMIWNKLPGFLTMVGMLLVIISGIFAVYFGQKALITPSKS